MICTGRPVASLNNQGGQHSLHGENIGAYTVVRTKLSFIGGALAPFAPPLTTGLTGVGVQAIFIVIRLGLYLCKYSFLTEQISELVCFKLKFKFINFFSDGCKKSIGTCEM